MDLSNVRIREHFGLISNDSHTEKFTFLISPPKGRASVQKTDYVLVDHPLFGDVSQVLAVIIDVASYEEIAGSTINDKKAKMLATAQVLGSIDMRKDNKPLDKLLVPPNPGSRVYIPLKGFLEDILNRNLKGESYKNPLQIGTFEGLSAEEQQGDGEIKCAIDAQELTGKHTLISSVAGAGKTYTTKKLCKALQEKALIQTVVFDFYGEYIENTYNFELTPKMDKETLLKEIRKGRAISLNGNGLTIEEKRSVYTEALKVILKLRQDGKVVPLLLVIEEAENLKGETLNDAVAQGRKTGLSLCLLTSCPSELGGRILSQTGKQIMGKTTNPADLGCLANFAGAENALSELTLGEWIINGIDSYRPMKIHVK